MNLRCYYCNIERPKSQMKRCARCLLVTYCSKECQAASWKISHKYNCRIHPAIASPDDPNKPVPKAEHPKKFTDEWINLEVDKALSRWLGLWRSSFCTWTYIALDLANHPADRGITHCMKLVIQPVHFEDDPAKQYELVEASVAKFTDVVADFPEIDTRIDPEDLTRFRFVVVMQNREGEPRRLRLVQWNDLNAHQWRQKDKSKSASLNSNWAQHLAFSLENFSPAKVEEMFGKEKSDQVNRERLLRLGSQLIHASPEDVMDS
ncbi:hypothetical protein CVT26_000461 [Gymnopilus dilepis]|uniref:MYND-type domain-containing protein n=1 Tax=Gymnopilus dilepis TaxID=231916 RepID=A0A409Y2E4_9AGAR|nr:hypothetical protein CVT26_000461 [Gymnopilus dilepis]